MQTYNFPLFLYAEKLVEFNKKTGDGNQNLDECQLQELIKICEPGASCTLDDISRLDLLLEWPQGNF